MATERSRRALKAVQDISDSDFRDMVGKLLKGMGLTTKAVRTSGRASSRAKGAYGFTGPVPRPRGRPYLRAWVVRSRARFTASGTDSP